MQNETDSQTVRHQTEIVEPVLKPPRSPAEPVPATDGTPAKSAPDSVLAYAGRFDLLHFYRGGRKAKPWLFMARTLAVALVAATVLGAVWYYSIAQIGLVNGSFVVAGPEEDLKRGLRFLAVCWVLWVIAPPAWFAIEYFYLFDHTLPESEFSRFKYGQELTTKAWATVVVVLGTFLYKSFK